MDLRAILFVLIVAGYVGFEVNAVRMSQHLFEPLFTFDQFASMRHASRECGAPEPGQREQFERNFAAVETRARRSLAEENPQSSPERIAVMLSERRSAREREVDAAIEAGGCADRELWKWLKLYDQRARSTVR
ncbi:MAG: hypothetical protein QNK04_09415 [Myxococcota bacterium]|nr:hypothetical protein [Myxococcota bacterium]